jgi:hypothetical protein
MLSLKAKVTLERFAKSIQTNIEWTHQERQKALDLSRSDSSVQKSVYEGHVEALTEIEKKLSAAAVKTNQLVARRDATVDEAMAVVVELKTDLEACKTEIDKIYQLDMNNWRVLGKSEMYQKMIAATGHLLNELKSANA